MGGADLKWGNVRDAQDLAAKTSQPMARYHDLVHGQPTPAECVAASSIDASMLKAESREEVRVPRADGRTVLGNRLLLTAWPPGLFPSSFLFPLSLSFPYSLFSSLFFGFFFRCKIPMAEGLWSNRRNWAPGTGT